MNYDSLLHSLTKNSFYPRLPYWAHILSSWITTQEKTGLSTVLVVLVVQYITAGPPEPSLVYFQPRFRCLLWGFKPVMQIQWNERDGAALHGPGLRLMRLQSCGLLHQQNEAQSTSGLNTSTMIRLQRLEAMTRRATLGQVWWELST